MFLLQVKDKLVELLPKFKKKINKELEEKNKTLSENPGKDDKRFSPHSLHPMAAIMFAVYLGSLCWVDSNHYGQGVKLFDMG